MSDEENPDLSEFEEGNEIRVTYRSQRSGNEVDRKGIVSAIFENDDGPVVRVHTEERNPLKHTFVAMSEAESKDGEVRVHAWSQTLEPEGLDWENGPSLARSYVLAFEVSRSSYLGPVRDITRTDRSGNYIMADGGYTFGGPRPAKPERCPQCERLVSRYVNGNRCPYCHEETFEDDGELIP